MNHPVEVVEQLVRSICQVLIGKEKQVRQVLVALLARGHVLIEDIPGVGKTLLALATSRSMGVRFRRIQFTSDSLPSDVLGVSIYNPKTSDFEFKEGPIFTEVLLADEINRTSPRTQSALLEAMAEAKVSVDGMEYELARPFFVLATMNPVERFGSFDLPESQLDRFMMSISLGYPDRDYEREIFSQDMEHVRAEQLQAVTDGSVISAIQDKVREVKISEEVMDYLLDLVKATREDSSVKLGLSSRAGLHLKRAMQATAIMNGRDYAVPSDLRSVFSPVAVHRIIPASGAGHSQARQRRKDILNRILQTVEAPM